MHSDYQRGTEGALKCDPGDLRVPLEQLRDRYDGDLWAAFEAAMRAAKIEELGGISVWEWLGSQKIVSPSNPLFKGPIPPLPKSVDDSLRELGLDKKTAWTEEEIKKLVSELKETSPAPVAHFIRAIHHASAEVAFSEAHIRRTVESVVSMLPPDVANALTSKKLTLSVPPAST